MFLIEYVIPFLAVLTVLVFVHEMGHYLVARWCGVSVEVFSVGFGREIWGRNDRHGTRWRLSLFPVGGYVKFRGDVGAASTPDVEANRTDTDPGNFHSKSLGQRAAVVAAGPIANFLLAIAIFWMLFVSFGQPFTTARVSEVVADSPAAEAGMQPGDLIVSAGGSSIDSFEDLRRVVALNLDSPMEVLIERDGRELSLQVQPRVVELTDRFGNTSRVGQLGVRSVEGSWRELGPVGALTEAVRQTWIVVTSSLEAIGDMIAGARPLDELRGPAGIAQMSGQAASVGIASLVSFAAFLSISLGLINLFPIPMLDGGHLLFYAVEAVRGRPLGAATQELGYKIGLAMVLALMVLATTNDILHLGVVDFVRNLFS
ncbi:MAG: RIP metalloprotease RseP [Pseudomonadota bacterium]|nr:RIP metalloprotease RseP [Pseudomonadota bacterium]